MAQRHMYPSIGALRRSLALDVVTASKCSSRTFQSSACRFEEQPSKPSPSTPAPNSRQARSALAMKQISNLQIRRTPAGPARGPPPGGQLARRTPRPQSGSPGEPGSAPTGAPSRFAKNAADPTTARGPSQFRAPRNPTVGSARGGPNLRARDGKPGQGPRRVGPNNSGDKGPKKRDKAKSSAGSAPPRKTLAETDLAETLSDGMIHHLLRIQRKEWDRTPYEPKYAKGSFAANELIHIGRELFKGESPPVKIWGPLEKRIGVVGMFGAEAKLQIRREGDGDAEPFGQEILETEEPEKAKDAKKETPAVQ